MIGQIDFQKCSTLEYLKELYWFFVKKMDVRQLMFSKDCRKRYLHKFTIKRLHLS